MAKRIKKENYYEFRCIKYVMLLYRFARDIEHDCVVNGQLFPKGATLDIPAFFLHHDPEHWPEAEKFIPER